MSVATSMRLGFSGSAMSNRMPLPEHAPAASFSAGKTVMSWHWSVVPVNCVPSPFAVGAAIVLSTPKSRLRSAVAWEAAPVKAGAVTVDQ